MPKLEDCPPPLHPSSTFSPPFPVSFKVHWTLRRLPKLLILTWHCVATLTFFLPQLSAFPYRRDLSLFQNPFSFLFTNKQDFGLCPSASALPILKAILTSLLSTLPLSSLVCDHPQKRPPPATSIYHSLIFVKNAHWPHFFFLRSRRSFQSLFSPCKFTFLIF